MEQYNFPAYGYMGVDKREEPQPGKGYSGRLLSLFSAAAKPEEGPQTASSQENFNIAMKYFESVSGDLNQLVKAHKAATVDSKVLELYKDLCSGLRYATNLTTGVFQVVTGRVKAQIAVPDTDFGLVVEMIDDMRKQVTLDLAGTQRRPVTHIDAVCNDAARIITEFSNRGGIFDEVTSSDSKEYKVNQKGFARDIVPMVPLVIIKANGVGQRMSLWATALARLVQTQDARQDNVIKALTVLREASSRGQLLVDQVTKEFESMITDSGSGTNITRYSQMSNVDHVFNLYYWFWWLKTKVSGKTTWGFQEFKNMLSVVRAVYYSDVGAKKARTILQNIPSVFAELWLKNSNEQDSRFQAPWNPHFQRLRWLSLFVPTEVNRLSNPITLSYGYEVCFVNIATEDPDFWKLLTSVYISEKEEKTQYKASEHTLHRLLVGQKSPLQNTQNVIGNALNVEIVPRGSNTQRPSGGSGQGLNQDSNPINQMVSMMTQFFENYSLGQQMPQQQPKNTRVTKGRSQKPRPQIEDIQEQDEDDLNTELFQISGPSNTKTNQKSKIARPETEGSPALGANI